MRSAVNGVKHLSTSDAVHPAVSAKIKSVAGRTLEMLGLRDAVERFWWRVSPGWTAKVDLVQAAHYGPALDRVIAAQLERRGGAPFGDYLEFGVYNGRSMSVAFRAFGAAQVSATRLIGFDSFQGMPHGSDDAGVFRGGELYFSEKSARAEMLRDGVDLERITLVKGWYDDTLNEATRRRLGLQRLGIAMIDCVAYKSTCAVLRFIEPLIVEEAILIFDDWTCHDMHLNNQGEKRAFDEWLRVHTDLLATEIGSFEPHARLFRVERMPRNIAGHT